MQKSGFTEKLKKKFSLGGVTLWGGILFAFLIFFDQITKILAEKFLSDGKSVKIFGKFVQLRLVYNSGISFGMFSDGSVASKVAIIVLTSLMMLALAAGEPSKGYVYPQHHPKVKFDESVLSTGAAVFVDCALQYLRE